MNTKEAIEFCEKLLTSDPYSEDIFLPIPKKDFTKINELLKREMGYPLDRVSGNVGRELYKSLNNSKELRNIISLLQQGEKYRQMWEEYKNSYGELNKMYFPIWDEMEQLEEKYFPERESQIKEAKDGEINYRE